MDHHIVFTVVAFGPQLKKTGLRGFRKGHSQTSTSADPEGEQGGQEIVLLSTHNICFGWELRKLIFWNALLTKGLFLVHVYLFLKIFIVIGLKKRL